MADRSDSHSTGAQPPSQQPPAPPLVEAVLVAEFDIDVGSSLTFRYPQDYLDTTLANQTNPITEKYHHTAPITIKTIDLSPLDDSMLAELMLPDGAHLREEDWTMFFLNQPIFANHTVLANMKQLPLKTHLFSLYSGKMLGSL